MKFYHLLSLVPLPLLAAPAPIASQVVFEEVDGTLAIEAEHFRSQENIEKRAWHIVTTESIPTITPDGDPSHAATASGGAYLEILPDTRRSHGDELIHAENYINQPGKMAILTYKAFFNTPGRYYCWVRAFSTNTEDNGIHLGINNTWPESGARMQWPTQHKWLWDSKQRTEKVHLGVFGQIWIDVAKPGLHNIQFSMREDGFEFDKFILTTQKPDQNNPPKGFGPSTKLRFGTLPPAFKAPKTAKPAPPKVSTKPKAKPQKSGRFPAHWGNPPRIGTTDYVKLPGNFGHGSSTLKNWIRKNLKADKQNKGRPLKKTSKLIPASSFPAKDGFYLDQGKWLAIHPDHHKTAQTSTSFPYPSGKYDLTILSVGENDGSAPHEVLVNDTSVLKHTTPLSKKMFDTDAKYHGTAKNLELNLGDVIVVKSAVHSADGKEYSRARWSGLSITPANAATAAKQKPQQHKPKLSKKELLPLQQPRKPSGTGTVDISGALAQWQPVTLTLDGPFAHELDNDPNPFRDHAFQVTFTHESGSPKYTVPGYFAADGNASESSAQSGTKWRAHLSPDKPGRWNYQTHFFMGEDIVFKKKLKSSKDYSKSGSFNISATPADATGFYQEGRLTDIGKHILQLAGSKRYFLKAGADAPETLLAYADFDGTIARKKNVPLKTWSPHLQDWNDEDPTWKNGKGKGLIGALNYLSAKGMNAFSFLTYNAGGDGDNVWPFVSRNNKFHYDCSKLDQWNIIFSHAQKKGLFLHFKLQETEMDDNNRGHKNHKITVVPTALDGGDLGPERKLYLREIVARFGHHLALNWNLGEENTQSTKQQLDMANYLSEVDAYDHHLVIHSYPDQQEKVYRPLLGDTPLTGASLQNTHLHNCHRHVVKWVRASSKVKKPWGVAFDEPGNASEGTAPDPDYPGMPKDYKGPTIHQTRADVLWGTLLGGGWGVEYYFGYKLPQNDLICEDWRSRDQSWDYANIALQFFRKENIPVEEMTPSDELIGNPKHHPNAMCLAKKGLYLVYLNGGKNITLKPIEGDNAPTKLRWLNPRTGAITQEATISSLAISPPDKEDWLAILK